MPLFRRSSCSGTQAEGTAPVSILMVKDQETEQSSPGCSEKNKRKDLCGICYQLFGKGREYIYIHILHIVYAHMCLKYFKKLDKQLVTVAFRKVNYGTDGGGEACFSLYSPFYRLGFFSLYVYIAFSKQKIIIF